MKIYGMVVVSNDLYIARNMHDNPVSWASKEDQKFYLNKVVDQKPLGIIGKNTYADIKSNLKKESIYSKLPLIILDDTISYGDQKFVVDKNNNHIFTIIKASTLSKDIEYYCNYFENHTVFVLGGTDVYHIFLPFYDVFWMTLEKNIVFEKGIKLFSNCGTIDDVIKLFDLHHLKLDYIKNLSEKTDLYKFRKIKT